MFGGLVNRVVDYNFASYEFNLSLINWNFSVNLKKIYLNFYKKVINVLSNQLNEKFKLYSDTEDLWYNIKNN